MATTTRLIIRKGNPHSFNLHVKDDAGNDYNLTGKTVMFTVKEIEDDSDTDSLAIIQKDITVHSLPLEGRTILSLTSDDTNVPVKVYKWDIRIAEDPNVQMNTDMAVCEVKDIVTKRTL